MRQLNTQQMASVSLLALANARRLYDDAVILRHVERFPSALMVAGLAADELGKHVLVTSFYARDPTEEEWRKFWRRFRRHESKLGNALLGAWAGDLLDEGPPPDAAAFHHERLMATYVDVSDNGTVSTPSQVVVKGRVDEILDLLVRELTYCESVVGKVTPSKFAAVLESMRTTPDLEIRRIVRGRRPEAAMTFAMASRTGMARDQALIFAQQVEEIFDRLDRENIQEYRSRLLDADCPESPGCGTPENY